MPRAPRKRSGSGSQPRAPGADPGQAVELAVAPEDQVTQRARGQVGRRHALPGVAAGEAMPVARSRPTAGTSRGRPRAPRPGASHRHLRQRREQRGQALAQLDPRSGPGPGPPGRCASRSGRAPRGRRSRCGRRRCAASRCRGGCRRAASRHPPSRSAPTSSSDRLGDDHRAVEGQQRAAQPGQVAPCSPRWRARRGARRTAALRGAHGVRASIPITGCARRSRTPARSAASASPSDQPGRLHARAVGHEQRRRRRRRPRPARAASRGLEQLAAPSPPDRPARRRAPARAAARSCGLDSGHGERAALDASRSRSPRAARPSPTSATVAADRRAPSRASGLGPRAAASRRAARPACRAPSPRCAPRHRSRRPGPRARPPRAWVGSLELIGGPQPGEPGADDADVGLPFAGERAAAAPAAGLIQPERRCAAHVRGSGGRGHYSIESAGANSASGVTVSIRSPATRRGSRKNAGNGIARRSMRPRRYHADDPDPLRDAEAEQRLAHVVGLVPVIDHALDEDAHQRETADHRQKPHRRGSCGRLAQLAAVEHQRRQSR